MIIITYRGPHGCGKTTAIKLAIKELERRGLICRNVGKRMGPPSPWSPVDVLFRETIGPAPLGVEVTPYAPTMIHVAAFNAMMDAGKQVAGQGQAVPETEAVKSPIAAKVAPFPNADLIKRASPSMFRLIEGHLLDDEIIAALNRVIDAAREEGRDDAGTEAPDEPVAHPGYLVWNPQGPHRPGFVHPTIGGAADEAKRLANAHPDNTFFLMAPISAHLAVRVAQPATFREIQEPAGDFELDDHIPF